MKYLAVDTETTGVDLRRGDSPFAVSACDEEGQTFFWEWDIDPYTGKLYVSEEDVEELAEVFSHKILIFHNAKFDLRALANLGLVIEFLRPDLYTSYPLMKELEYNLAVCPAFEDTLLASHVCDSSEPHGLKYLAEEYLDILPDDQEDLVEAVREARRYGKTQGWEVSTSVHCDYWMPRAVDPDNTLLEKYATQDVIRTMLLWKMYQSVMETDDKLQANYDLRKKLVAVSYRMENHGITIKPRIFQSEIQKFHKMALREEIACQEIAKDDFNINSGVQIQEILYGIPDGVSAAQRKGLGCPIIQETKTGISTSGSTLLTLYNEHTGTRSKAHKFLGHLLKYRKATTCGRYLLSYEELSSYDDAKRQLLYPNFNQTGTRTTRWSSSNPNGQNVGAGGKDAFGNESDEYCLRTVFGPSKGRVWVCVDYSQLELRILSVLAQEKAMLEAFSKGEDIHQLTADLCDIPRKYAKNVNFALIYGAGKAKLDEMTGVSNFSKVFGKAYPGIRNYMKTMTSQVNKAGYVTTLGGYRLIVPPDRPYIGTNYSVQGSAGDILNRAMVGVDSLICEGLISAKLIMCIHDELVFDIAKKDFSEDLVKQITKCMEDAGKSLGVATPVDAKKVTTKWSQGKELNYGSQSN